MNTTETRVSAFLHLGNRAFADAEVTVRSVNYSSGELSTVKLGDALVWLQTADITADELAAQLEAIAAALRAAQRGLG